MPPRRMSRLPCVLRGFRTFLSDQQEQTYLQLVQSSTAQFSTLSSQVTTTAPPKRSAARCPELRLRRQIRFPQSAESLCFAPFPRGFLRQVNVLEAQLKSKDREDLAVGIRVRIH